MHEVVYQLIVAYLQQTEASVKEISLRGISFLNTNFSRSKMNMKNLIGRSRAAERNYGPRVKMKRGLLVKRVVKGTPKAYT